MFRPEDRSENAGASRETPAAQPAYALGHAPDELRRLMHQARFIGELTEQWLRDAGIGAGMRVLDVGCGAGDVSFLAAALVGPRGQVIGIDRSPEAIALATARAQAAGLSNVQFLVRDLTEFEFWQKADALIGRLVLMYLPQPGSALRHLARQVKPGGVIAFQEIDMDAAKSVPHCPLFETGLERIRRTFDLACPHPRVALALGAVFEGAGLRAPRMVLAARVERGPDSPIYEMAAGITRTLLPQMERFGIATAAEVQVDTLADRLRLEAGSHGATIVSPGYVGAWTAV